MSVRRRTAGRPLNGLRGSASTPLLKATFMPGTQQSNVWVAGITPGPGVRVLCGQEWGREDPSGDTESKRRHHQDHRGSQGEVSPKK